MKKPITCNKFQNITIAVLTVSAVLLFAQTQLYALGYSFGSGSITQWLDRQMSTGTTAGSSAVSLTDVPAAVHVAVTSSYGRYGRIDLTTTNSDFSPLSILLVEALGSSGPPSDCTADELQACLQQSVSVYCDFLQPWPLTLLSGLIGAAPTDHPPDHTAVRSLLLAASNETVSLYLWDGADSYTCRPTHVTAAALQDTTSQYEPGSAFFAFETAPNLAPFSLLVSDLPAVPELSAVNGPVNADSILSQLGFNPHSKFRYTEPSSGTEVLVEDSQSVHIAPNGLVSYAGSRDSLSIPSASEFPTESEAVLGCWRLLLSLTEHQLGEAKLYLAGIQYNGSESTLTFGLLVNGLPVQFQDGSPAAEVSLSGRLVTGCTFRCRQYLSEQKTAALLPVQQAVAIAQQRWSGCGLTVCYLDDGTSPLSTQWIAN